MKPPKDFKLIQSDFFFIETLCLPKKKNDYRKKLLALYWIIFYSKTILKTFAINKMYKK